MAFEGRACLALSGMLRTQHSIFLLILAPTNQNKVGGCITERKYMELEKRVNLRPFEAVVIVHPDASEEEQKNLFKKNKSIIESFKGSVNHLDTWGKRSLASPIDGSKKAYFFHTTFQAEPAVIAELERTMRINDKVLRYMHTRLKDKTNLAKFVEEFKNSLAESANREREREAKFQARKAAQKGARDGARKDFGKNADFDMEEDI